MISVYVYGYMYKLVYMFFNFTFYGGLCPTITKQGFQSISILLLYTHIHTYMFWSFVYTCSYIVVTPESLFYHTFDIQYVYRHKYIHKIKTCPGAHSMCTNIITHKWITSKITHRDTYFLYIWYCTNKLTLISLTKKNYSKL